MFIAREEIAKYKKTLGKKESKKVITRGENKGEQWAMCDSLWI